MRKKNVLLIEDEKHYLSYLTLEELTHGQFANEEGFDFERYRISKIFYENLIDALESNCKVMLNLSDGYGAKDPIQFRVSLGSLRKALATITHKMDNPYRKIIPDHSLYDSFEVMRELFIESNQAELTVKN